MHLAASGAPFPVRPDFQDISRPLWERFISERRANHSGGQVELLHLGIHEPCVILEPAAVGGLIGEDQQTTPASQRSHCIILLSIRRWGPASAVGRDPLHANCSCGLRLQALHQGRSHQLQECETLSGHGVRRIPGDFARYVATAAWDVVEDQTLQLSQLRVAKHIGPAVRQPFLLT
jgi:hypothetical protein